MKAVPASSLQRKRASGDAAATQARVRDLKHELKSWEAEFHSSHGRSPTKEDLDRLPEIACKYRHYSRLKRAARTSPGGPTSSQCQQTAGTRRGPLQGSAQPPSTHDDTALLPLETSILAMSLKRKATAHSTGKVSPAPIQRSRKPLEISFELPVKSRPEEEPAESAPKRLCVAPLVEPFVTPEAGARTVVHDAAGADARSDGCEAVTYVPPPSLIRSYNQRAPSAPAQPTSNGPDSTSLAHMTQSNSQAGPVPISIGSGAARMSIFETRAGGLTKTKSVPLSTFDAKLRGGSQLTFSQSNLGNDDDDGDERTGGSAAGILADLDVDELVLGDSADEEEEEEERAGSGSTVDQPEPQRKKATQKRSTRRVKLRPIEKDGSAKSTTRAPRTSGGYQPVSQNFYQLKLKGGRRGPKSAVERRAALYKRMVGKKKASVPGSTDAVSHGTGTGGGPLAGVPDLELVDEEGRGETTDGSDGEQLVDENGGDLDKPAQRSGAGPGEILGQPLSYFCAGEGSDPDQVCKLGLPQAGSGSPPDNVVSLDLCKVLGHIWQFSEFRPGQAEAMRRVIEGKSTLLSLGTGAGKSLVYQLPSAILSAAYGGLTLVVTPLISLMRDQIRHLPVGLCAVCMSSESPGQDGYRETVSRLASGQAKLLFVAPERLQSPRFQEMMAQAEVPRVHLAVVDEAHCADEWSHNFRPAYLQLPQLLAKLDVKCVLAMTGTATSALAARLCAMFKIDASSGMVQGSVVRKNIKLSVVPVDLGSRPLVKSSACEDALVSILRSPDMARLDSIIVYVWTQANADRIAEYLTIRSIPAQSYHAGKSAAERSRIQTSFMQTAPTGSGTHIRVLVATVAFGLGLNKSDIRAVVHFNLPRGMEAYVQEIGRAGRDGAPARGVLLLAVNSCEQRSSCTTSLGRSLGHCSTDAVVLRSRAHTVGIDIASIRRLLHRLFPAGFMRKAVVVAQQARAQGAAARPAAWQLSHTAVMVLKDLEADIDADQATAQTLVNYLALMEPGMIQMEPNTHRKCAVRFTRTDLGKLAEAHELFAAIAKCTADKDAPAAVPQRTTIITYAPAAKKPTKIALVDVFNLATLMNTEPAEVVSELYRWRAKREVMLEWQEPSCVVKVTLDTSKFADGHSTSDREEWSEELTQKMDEYIVGLAAAVGRQNESRIKDSLHRVDSLETAMLVANEAGRRIADRLAPAASALELARSVQSDILQTAIEMYFSSTVDEREQVAHSLVQRVDDACAGVIDRSVLSSLADPPNTASAGDLEHAKAEIRERVRAFVNQHADRLKSARAIARVFHGLASPSCTPSEWMWSAEWGSLVAVDFEAVRQCAQEELVQLHCRV